MSQCLRAYVPLQVVRVPAASVLYPRAATPEHLAIYQIKQLYKMAQARDERDSLLASLVSELCGEAEKKVIVFAKPKVRRA